MSLQPQHAQFVAEYLACFNVVEAAVRAGIHRGRARYQAAKMLARADVSQALATALESRLKGAEIRSEWVLRELANIARSDLLDLVDERGSLRSLKDIPEHARRTISKFKVTEYPDGRVVQEIGLWDKIAALDKLGRHLKLFEGGEAKGGDMVINFLNVAPPRTLPASPQLTLPSGEDEIEGEFEEQELELED
jgi:phage terminase small subunit